GDGLVANRRTVCVAGRRRAVAGRRAESRGGDRTGARAGGGTDRARGHRRHGATRLSPLARGPRRLPPPSRALDRGRGRIPPGARAHRQRARADVLRDAARGVRGEAVASRGGGGGRRGQRPGLSFKSSYGAEYENPLMWSTHASSTRGPTPQRNASS